MKNKEFITPEEFYKMPHPADRGNLCLIGDKKYLPYCRPNVMNMMFETYEKKYNKPEFFIKGNNAQDE